MLKYLMRFVVLAAMLTIPWSVVLAQDTPDTRPGDSLGIAVINMKVVRQKSTAMQTIREQISAMRVDFQAQVQTEEESLRAANQELARQRSILGAEAFAEERRIFESRLADVQRNVQKRRQALEQARDKAAAEVQGVLNEVIAAIARERGLGLILLQERVIFVVRTLEITREVVERLNTAMPSVTVPQPGQ